MSEEVETSLRAGRGAGSGTPAGVPASRPSRAAATFPTAEPAASLIPTTTCEPLSPELSTLSVVPFHVVKCGLRRKLHMQGSGPPSLSLLLHEGRVRMVVGLGWRSG